MIRTSYAWPLYWRGLRDALPFLLVFLPFGMLFGIAGTAAGFSFLQVMGFSVLVVAGASQFTAVQLMNAHTPTILVMLTALAVNLRMAMYSASLAPYLGAASPLRKMLVAYTLMDQSFALSAQQYETAPQLTLGQKLAYFSGCSTLLLLSWWAATVLGAVFGQALPSGLALDFAVPVTFIAMIAPGLRSLPHLIAAGVSATAALVFARMPAGTGVLVAAAIAMWAGATTETLLARRRAGLEERG